MSHVLKNSALKNTNARSSLDNLNQSKQDILCVSEESSQNEDMLKQKAPDHPAYHLGVIVRANRGIGTGHLMRIKSLVAKLKNSLAKITLYAYAFDEALIPLCNEYDEIKTFEDKEDILKYLLTLAKSTKQEHLPLSDKSKLTSSNNIPLLSLNISLEPTTINTTNTTTTSTSNLTSAISFVSSKEELATDTLPSRNSAPPQDTPTTALSSLQSFKSGIINSNSSNSNNNNNSSNNRNSNNLAINSLKQEQIADFPHVIIIDDYAIDETFEKQLYSFTKLFVIDDLANRKHCCHILLDQTLIPKVQEYTALCNSECKLLLGAQYSLTQEEFYPYVYAQHLQTCTKSSCHCLAHNFSLSYRALVKQHSSTCLMQDSLANPFPRVFVSFGGADPVSACLQLCKTILEHKLYEQYIFTILAGASNKDFNNIQELLGVAQNSLAHSSLLQSNILLLKHCNNVADLLYKHDIAIGAYGGMYRERIAAGIPTVGVEIADNQAGASYIAQYFDLGISLDLKDLANGTKVKKALTEVLKNAQRYTQNCWKVYDGQGLNRITSELIALFNR